MTLACLVQLLLTTRALLAAAPTATPEAGDATRDLESGNVPAAIQVLESSIAAAPAIGWTTLCATSMQMARCCKNCRFIVYQATPFGKTFPNCQQY